jgi:microcystin-dependent protein
MARYSFQGTFRDSMGNIVSNGYVYVNLAGTTTDATIYADDSTVTSSNYVLTDDNGYFVFYVDTVDYLTTQQFKITLRKTGYAEKVYDDIVIFPITGAAGSAGSDGADAFVYIAYASDSSGTDFTTTFDADLNYIAILSTTTEIEAPAVGDFAGLWKNYKGATGATGTSLPTGGYLAFAGETAPEGFLECNGAAVSRTTYSDLFAVIAEMYGNGDGSTTFNVPDVRGYFLRGWDHTAGNDPDRATRTDRGDTTDGDNVGTKQDSQNDEHLHTSTGTIAASADHVHYLSTWTNVNQANTVSMGGAGNGPYTNAVATSAGGAHAHTISISVANQGGAEARPKNIYVMYCIKT